MSAHGKGQFNNNAFKPNEFATFNEMAKLEQNHGDWLPISRRWLHYKQVLFVEINGDQALDPYNMSIEKLCSVYYLGQFVMTMRKYLTNIQHEKHLFLGFPMGLSQGKLEFPLRKFMKWFVW